MEGAADVTDTGIDVLANTDIDVVVAPATHLRGLVQLGQWRRLPSARVLVFAEDPRSWDFKDSRFVRTAVSSTTGEFEIIGLPPGRYYAAVPGGMLADESDVRALPELDELSALAGGATRFSIATGERRTLVVTVG